MLGDEHPDVATSLNNLAALYKSQGRYIDAEPLYKDALYLGFAEKVSPKFMPLLTKNFLTNQ